MAPSKRETDRAHERAHRPTRSLNPPRHLDFTFGLITLAMQENPDEVITSPLR